MGWGDDLWKWAGDVKDEIFGVGKKLQQWIDKVTNELRRQIEKIKNWIIEKLRVWRHKLNKALAKWFNSTLGFWVTIGVVVAAIVAAIKLGQAGKLGPIIEKVIGFKQSIEATLQALIGKLHLDLVFTINDILITLIPQYREVWQDLYNALGSIAEELDLGPGSIANTLRNINMTIASTYILLGFPPETAEIQFYLNSADIWDKIDDNFEKYAKNPQQIFDDIREWVLTPSMKNVEGFRRGLDEKFETFNTKLQTFSKNLIDWQVNLNSTINDLPGEIREAVNNRVGPFMKGVNKFIDKTVIPVISKVDEIYDIVDEYADREEVRYQRVKAFMESKLNNVLMWKDLNAGEKLLVKFGLNNILETSLFSTEPESLIDLGESINNNFDKELNKLGFNNKLKPSTISSVDVYIPEPDFIPTTREWFRGEY